VLQAVRGDAYPPRAAAALDQALPFPWDVRPVFAGLGASACVLPEEAVHVDQAATVPLRDDAEKLAAREQACLHRDAGPAVLPLALPSAQPGAPVAAAQCKPGADQSAA
jgi:hypothetical protein